MKPESMVRSMTLIIAICAFSHAAAAQGEKVIAERQEKLFLRYLAVRIDEMQRVCRLTDRQVRKLEVAAKGAVDRAMTKWSKQVNPQTAQAGNRPLVLKAVDDLADAEDAPRVVEKPKAKPRAVIPVIPAPPAGVPNPFARNGFAQIRSRVRVINLGGGVAVASVVKEPVWTKTVERVLSEEQKQARRTAVADRTAFKRRATVRVQRWVVQIDAELFLSNQQRRQLVKVLSEQHAMQPFAGFPGGAGQRHLIIGNIKLRNVANQIPQSKLKGILSGAQLNRWNDIKSGPADGMGKLTVIAVPGGIRIKGIPGEVMFEDLQFFPFDIKGDKK